MKTRTCLALAIGALVAVMLPGVVAAQDEAEGTSLLFVVSANSGAVEGDTLTLEAVPAVVWFTDRPARGAGHIEPADLAGSWVEGEDSFADDPPNAVLSILDEDTINDAVIALTGIQSRTNDAGAGDDMVFTFEMLDGELSQGPIGTVSLFIDDFTYTGDHNSGGINTGDYNSGRTNTGGYNSGRGDSE